MSMMSIALPNTLKQKMDEHQEINWSAVARQAFDRKLSDLELLNKIKEHSTLTEEDAITLGRKLNEQLAKHYQARHRR